MSDSTKTGKINLSDFAKQFKQYTNKLLEGSYDRFILVHKGKAALAFVTFKWLKRQLDELAAARRTIEEQREKIHELEQQLLLSDGVDSREFDGPSLDLVDTHTDNATTESQDMLLELREKFAFLEDLNHGDILEVTKNVEFMRFERGQVIFKQGDQGEEVFYIIQGGVQILLETPERRIPLAALKPQSIFGEMAPITHEARSATAAASAEETMLLKFEIDHDRMRKSPVQFALLYRNFIKVLSGKLIIANMKKT